MNYRPSKWHYRQRKMIFELIMHFIANFAFREWNFQFRELLREYPGTLREPREWPFHSESVFPEIGVVPRLLKLIRRIIFGCNLSGWADLGQKSQKIPSFIVKKMAKKHPHLKGGGFSCFNVSSSFLSLPFSALVFLLSLCFLTF